MKNPEKGRRVKVLFHPVTSEGYGPVRSKLGTIVSMSEIDPSYGEVLWDGDDAPSFLKLDGGDIRAAEDFRPPNAKIRRRR